MSITSLTNSLWISKYYQGKSFKENDTFLSITRKNFLLSLKYLYDELKEICNHGKFLH